MRLLATDPLAATDPTTTETPAADDVAMLLRRLEDELDRAFATAGELAAALPRARAEARLSAVVGQSAFTAFSAAMGAIGEARGYTVNGHRILEKIAESVGYEVAFGDVRPKPPMSATASVTPLAVAA